MSYFDFFLNNVYQNQTGGGDSVVQTNIRGMCFNMCPQEEIEIRTKEHLVHELEVVGSEKKFVKSYHRPAADMIMAVPSLLRPYNILKDTIHYLLIDVASRTDVRLASVYDFIDDRLRAIRQDMTIQRLPPQQSMTLLEPMVRFYIYFGYRLCDHPIRLYDPVLNQKYLLECLKLFLNYSDTDSSIDNIGQLSGFLNDLDIGRTVKTTCDKVLMEMLYIMCNLDDLHPIVRYLNLPKKLKSHPSLVLAYKIAIANMQGNYVRVAKLSNRLCPLSYYALRVYLPVLQRKALHIMSHGYNSRQLSVPCHTLREWLLINSDAEVIEACTYYGLKVQGDKVHFSRADFKFDELLQAKKNLIPNNHPSELKMEQVLTSTCKS